MGRLRYLTAGESHGEMLIGILEGMPAGVQLSSERDIDPVLRERQKGYGRGRRQQIERDFAKIISGVRFGVTTGAPIGIIIQNRDWVHWQTRMAIDGMPTEVSRVTIPRPGHADLAGALKYNHETDTRNILERASARETAMRVAIGAISNKLLQELGIESIAHVISIGGIVAAIPDEESIFNSRDFISANPVRICDDLIVSEIQSLVDQVKAEGDTVGGNVEVRFRGMPPGVGSHVHWDRKLDSKIAQAVMSVQAVKAVEIGSGKDSADRTGSKNHDPIELRNRKITHRSNNAGGIEGGMSNGETIVVRAAMKPISTLMRPLQSIDFATGTSADAHIERSDVCAVPALAIIVENVVALTLASEILECFGGDTLRELQDRVAERQTKLTLGKTPTE